MNSAYSKLKREGIEVNFARTTTGDGYYVWNRDLGVFPNVDLLTFFLLVLIDNAVAREKSQFGSVPTLRSAFHIGSHYELSQAEGINPTVLSYIVGDVTIKLARLVESVPPAGIHMGDFLALLPDSDVPATPGGSGAAGSTTQLGSPELSAAPAATSGERPLRDRGALRLRRKRGPRRP